MTIVACSDGVGGHRVGARLFSSVGWPALAGHTVFRRFDQLNASDERTSGGQHALPMRRSCAPR